MRTHSIIKSYLKVLRVYCHIMRPYKIDAKYNTKHNIATKCENNVLKIGRSLDVC